MVKDITAEVAAVIPATSQPLAAPSISQPSTAPTEANVEGDRLLLAR